MDDNCKLLIMNDHKLNKQYVVNEYFFLLTAKLLVLNTMTSNSEWKRVQINLIWIKASNVKSIRNQLNFLFTLYINCDKSDKYWKSYSDKN